MSLASIATVVAMVSFAMPARAQDAALELSTLRTSAGLTSGVSWLEDRGGKLELPDVMHADGFRSSEGKDMSLGYTRSAYWLRFAVSNASPQMDSWLLDVGYSHLADVDLFAVHGDGSIDHVRGGNRLPFAARLVDYSNFAFPIETPAGETTRFFLRVRADAALRAPLVAWRMTSFMTDVAQRNAWLWMFWGGALLVAAFNFGVAWILRNLEYVYCGLMLLAEAFCIFSLNGETYHYLVPTWPEIAARTQPASYALLALSIQMYGYHAIRQLPDPPATLRVLRASMPFSYAMLAFAAFGPMWMLIRVGLVYSVAMAIFALYMMRSLTRYHELRFHMMSLGTLLLTFPIAVVAYANIIKPHPLAFVAANLGCGLHAVLTSFALPQRIREMGERLARMNQQLQSNVVELKGALESADQATKAKDLFVANMSHELRTPLNAIINIPQGLVAEFEQVPAAHCAGCKSDYLLDQGETIEGVPCPTCGSALQSRDMFRFRGDATRSVRFLRKLERCGHHLLSMVNDVLDFSKLEAGRLDVEPVSLSLGSLILEATDEMSELASRKQIQIELELPTESAPSNGDPLRLKQVLFNLLSNAIKFSEPGSRVLVRWRQETDHDRVEVVDCGIGIAPEHHERVFETFEQVHGGQRKYGGTGLGLSISRSLARRHGGDLWVESEIGKGSTFKLRLPRPASDRAQLSA